MCLRFWASVEPYCSDITNEEIRVLEELLKPPEDEAEYYKVGLLILLHTQTYSHNPIFTYHHLVKSVNAGRMCVRLRKKFVH